MTTSNNERAANGRFTKGNPGGPGRPPRQKEEECLAAMRDVVTLDRWRIVVERAIADAEEGDARARQWLSDYLIGKPTQRTEVTVEMEEYVHQAQMALAHELMDRAERNYEPFVFTPENSIEHYENYKREHKAKAAAEDS